MLKLSYSPLLTHVHILLWLMTDGWVSCDEWVIGHYWLNNLILLCYLQYVLLISQHNGVFSHHWLSKQCVRNCKSITYPWRTKVQIYLNSSPMSVHSDLGGGTHGHLCLVLSSRGYALHSDAAYCKLDHPGLLIIAPGTKPAYGWHFPRSAQRIPPHVQRSTRSQSTSTLTDSHGNRKYIGQSWTHQTKNQMKST